MKWVNLSEEQNVKFFSSMYNNESWKYVLDEIMLHYNFEYTYGVSNDIQKQFCQSNYNCRNIHQNWFHVKSAL